MSLAFKLNITYDISPEIYYEFIIFRGIPHSVDFVGEYQNTKLCICNDNTKGSTNFQSIHENIFFPETTNIGNHGFK